MKKLIIIAALFGLAACNHGTDQAGGASDAGKAVGGSLAVDSLRSGTSGTIMPKTKSLDSLDTVAKIKPSAIPAVDTPKRIP